MASANFFTGLLQGVGQGLEAQRRRKEQEEELKLKRQQFESGERLKQLQGEKIREELAKADRENAQRGRLREIWAEPEVDIPADEIFRGAGVEPPTSAARNIKANKLRGEMIGLPEAKDREFQNLFGIAPMAPAAPPLDPTIKAYLESQIPTASTVPAATAAPSVPSSGGAASAVPSQERPQFGVTIGPRGATVRQFAPHRPGVGVGSTTLEAMTQEEIARPPESLQPGESRDPRLRARKRYNEMQVKLAADTAAATTGGRIGAASTPAALQQKSDIAAAGAKGTQEVKARQQLIDLAPVESIVNEIASISERVNQAEPGMTGAGRFIQGAGKALGAMTQADTDATQLTNLRTSFATIISRGVLAERGVLTDQDRRFASESIPSVWDTKDVAALKVKRLKGLVKVQADAYKAIAEGRFNPADIRNKLDSLWKDAAPGGNQPGGSSPNIEDRLNKMFGG